jgi:energy-coupling factor transporter ATP-binding protein EcfA2
MPAYKISKVTFNNFKFFYQSVPINFDSKHLIVYGENGSGKSSLYWALYTFMQSIFKENVEIRKYFEPKHPENLINRFSTEPSNSSIQVELKDETGTTILKEISLNEISTKVDGVIRELTLGSDFINHHTLSRIYAYYHKEEINLFDIFEYELLAFITFKNPLVKEGEETGSENAESWWEYVKAAIPTFEKKEIIEKYLKEFNDNFKSYLNDITESTNKYITDTFKEDFNIKFEYRLATYPLPPENETPVEKGKEVQPPAIVMTVVMLTDKIAEAEKKEIDSPQSFLNEAKLSTIALALRLAILDEKYVEAFPKVLILDDMLMSMDLSNREFVLDIILDNYQADYQIVFLTHQRGLFEDAKNAIQQHYAEKVKVAGVSEIEKQNSAWLEHWHAYEMYVGEDKNGIPIPKIIPSGDSLQKAIYYFKENIDYSACGNNLRSALEEFFKRFIPDARKKASKEKQMLDGLLKDARDYFSYLGFNTTVLDKLDRYLKRALNKASHHNPKADFYKKELEDIFRIIEFLREMRNDGTIKTNDLMKFAVSTSEGNNYEYVVKLLDDIQLYKENSVAPSFYKPEDKHSYGLVAYFENAQEHPVNGEQRNKTLKELYDFTAAFIKRSKKETPIIEPDLYSVFKNAANRTLGQIKTY